MTSTSSDASTSPGMDPMRRKVLRTAAWLGTLSLGTGLATVRDAEANAMDIVLPSTSEAVTPFQVAIPPGALRDLKVRLAATRFPEKETVDDWSEGVPLAKMKALVEYWRSSYDMHRLERRLNSVPQYRTQIDGLGIHFLHVRSKHENALPIVLTHGWPGSVIEFLKVIGPLTDPTAHGGTADDAFHVVIPSLPGYGFSDKPTERGWGIPHIARAWAVLMKRLGYTSWVAQGGDWGAGVTTWMAKQHVEGLKAIHLNLPILFPPPVEGEPTAEEKVALAKGAAFANYGMGYSKLQSTRPQTIGYSLSDSPSGQAAWIYEKFAQWSDTNNEPERELSRDEMLDNITLYWLANTGASSARLYFESFATDFSLQKLDIPVGVSIFPGEIAQPPRIWGERTYSKLFYWNEVAKGGHFAAFEQPSIFVAELRACFSRMR
ncbi:epoxide hydrolase [Paraburkholderia ginsengiterrae]|uniref:Epoxide hydrolase n=1 Tax=Paraburkholderia ginsengiterrae TaxID=1462993 RepID=A0A1A9N3V7_9BURK|nr:epoxide hydrolase [Paraburkholderia ginsengiterrae]OAJ56813.1 epoxide hydrolase [Paraburkholderia ginsengiterrae]OAJ56872.1 epoxide hydrolase [Paraburkholderia ginsengiterrae]